MMMMGERSYQTSPPWAVFEEMPVSGVTGGGDCSPYMLGEAALAALQRYLPSNDSYVDGDDDEELAVDAYSCDEFRMYEFKIRRCARGRSHDWTECPYAHLGEKARRRDPRKYHYSGVACPDFRKGSCRRGDACEFAHGVFECWLHPSRYRTQPCKDGTACRRRVCFFAHTPEQLRVLQQQSPRGGATATVLESYDGSPMRRLQLEEYFPKSLMSSSPTSTLISPPVSPPSDSPPLSPGAAGLRASWPVAGAGAGMSEVLASLRHLQLSKAKSMPSAGWGVTGAVGGGGGVFGSPRAAGYRVGMCSLPSTPTRLGVGAGWSEEPVEERVESGRALRAKMFERLSKEVVEKPESGVAAGGAAPAPDVGWVSELVM